MLNRNLPNNLTTNEAFKEDSRKHIEDVQSLMRTVNYILNGRAYYHDADKLEFEGNLEQWKEYFRQGKHFNAVHNTHHHKEDVEDLFGVMEMLCDWVAASARRSGLLDPMSVRLPQLNWDKLIRKTLEKLVEEMRYLV